MDNCLVSKFCRSNLETARPYAVHLVLSDELTVNTNQPIPFSPTLNIFRAS